MRQINVLLFSLFFITNSIGQSWESFPFDVPYTINSHYYDSTTQVLYLGGHFKYLGGVEVNAIGSWDGQQIDSLQGGQDGCNLFNCQTIKSMTMYDGKLHVEIPNLYVNDLEPINSIGIWENDQWTSIDSGIPKGVIYNMQEYQDDLYAMGRWSHSNQDSIYGIIKWNKKKWNSVEFPFYSYDGDIITIFDATILENELYVGGNFRNTDASVKDVAKYDGSNWYPVGNGVNGGADDVTTITSYQGDIYIGGDFRASSGNAGNKIMRLQNGIWTDVAGGLDEELDIVFDLKVFNEKLYVFGRFKSVGGGIPANCIAVWDGEKWCGIKTDILPSGLISHASMMENDILVTGAFPEIGGIEAERIALWKTWTEFDTCGEATSTNNLLYDNIQFTITPNPTNDILNIKLVNALLQKNLQLQVTNLLGQSIFQQDIPVFDKEWTHQLDVSSFPSGTYFLTLQNGDGIVSRKFIVQR